MELREGMRVKVRDDLDKQNGVMAGKTATIAHIEDGAYGLEFDENLGLHSCGNKTRFGHGYYVDREDFTVIELPEPTDGRDEPRVYSASDFDIDEYFEDFLTDKKEEETVSEDKQWLPEDFAFAGERVILNPESRKYDETNTIAQNNAGYVINHKASDTDLEIILRSGSRHMSNWIIKVQFDNGNQANVYLKDLLKVQAPHKRVNKIRLSSGMTYYRFDEDMDSLDSIIITEGEEVRKHEVFDERYKQEKIAQAYEYITRNQ